MNERDIFTAARAISDSDERDAYLISACGGDDAVLQRIAGLLKQDASDDSFLELPDTQIGNADIVDELLPAGTSIGPYKLIERIGEGGFGVVYMAEQTEPLRRLVALKVIKPGMDSRQVIARFEAERQALAIMDHPGIARVFDAGTTDGTGRPYFVMELVKGVPINTFCDEHRYTPRQRLELFVPVCEAIQHAHSKGVIHRDIKPGNVLVAMYDDRPVPKVIDFGVAKATGQRLTEQTMHTGFGAVIGSVEYMSPEQASFNQLDIDIRSDVYSLGVLLYELLAGSPPLERNELEKAGLLESLRVIRESDPVPLSTKLSTAEGLPTLAANRATDPARLTTLLKGELDWIVMKSLEKDRNRRYETVNSFAADVRRFLTGEPIEAHPPSVTYRLSKFAARNKAMIAGSSLLLIVTIVGVALAIRSASQFEENLVSHSDLVSVAIEESSLALGAATAAPIGNAAEWAAARTSRSRIIDLLKVSPVDAATEARANAYLAAFDESDADRRLAEQIEDVVIMSATHEDLESWERMEQQFRDLFRARGIDLDTTPPAEVAGMIRADRSAAHLSDALELWIGTRGQLNAMGGPKLDASIMQPWAEAMYAADPDPVRNGIRRLIYETKPKPQDVEAVIKDVDLKSLSPRTLSWLGTTFQMAGDIGRCNDVFFLAIDEHPSDFMLNFDFAYTLTFQSRWQEAIRMYMRCTAIRPDVDGVWRGLGNALRENGELNRSLAVLTKAVSMAPQYAPIYEDLARTQLALEDSKAAELSARKAIELGNTTPRIYQLHGEALFACDRIAEALVAFEKCQQVAEQQATGDIDVTSKIAECRKRLSANSNATQSAPPGKLD